MTRPTDDVPMRVGLFNVKYSPNLGDGLLSECLEAELCRSGPRTVVRVLDLAGRSDFGEGSRYRGAALTLLEHSPTPVRHTVVQLVLGRALRRRMRPAWKEDLREVDAVVIGGGNLFGDSDLNFPLKIDAAMAEVRSAGVPAAVYGVGVSDNWSARGEVLFRRALTGSSLTYASVREARSAGIWNRRLGPAGVMPAEIVHDPGVLVALHQPPSARPPGRAPLVGIGLTHPTTLRYHADERSARDGDLTDWFAAVARACTDQGWRVAVFTNGSPEDDAYLRAMTPILTEGVGEGQVAVMPRFSHPRDLARFIGGLDLLMAHRLHAMIAAYSYGIPHVGFSWDAKVRSFLCRVDRGAFLCTAGIDAPQVAIDLAHRALAEGIDAATHGAVLAEARDDVRQLSRSLQAAVQARRSLAARTAS